MSQYAPKDKEYHDQLNETEHRLTQDINICKAVKLTLESEGWKKVIGPTLDRMIIDTVGGKIGNMWHYGELQKADDKGRYAFYVGYKQALIKFHNQIHNHLRVLKTKEGQVEAIEKDRKAGFNVPMLGEVKDNALQR